MFDSSDFSPAQHNKRQKILQATLKLLAQKGFHGFSIKQVAAEARVAIGTIYLYFSDREELIKQLNLELIQEVVGVAFSSWGKHTKAYDRYCCLCHKLWVFFEDKPQVLLCKSQFDQLPINMLHDKHSIAKSLFAPLNSLFEEGRQRGIFANLPDEALYCMSLGVILDLARDHILGIVQVDSALLGQVIEGTWRGMLRPSEPFDCNLSLEKF